MDDPHQVNTIIATAIYDAAKDRPDGGIGIEDAKLVGKRVVEALNDAGMQIIAVDRPSASRQ